MKCKYCGKEFDVKGGKVYCNKTCYIQWKRADYLRKKIRNEEIQKLKFSFTTTKLGPLEKKADKLWSEVVKLIAGGRCQYSGGEGAEAHHIFVRGRDSTRFDPNNGIYLSYEVHRTIAHGQAKKFKCWLQDRMGDEYDMLEQKSISIVHESQEWYEEQIANLEAIKLSLINGTYEAKRHF